VLGRRRVFDLDAELDGMTRIEQAVAFLAVLELRRSGEVALEQAAPFAPIRVRRAESNAERRPVWTGTARSA
jgi:chromatin segregation and condensation protein Rec8/ScpA/Scc1 (kleisin family)